MSEFDEELELEKSMSLLGHATLNPSETNINKLEKQLIKVSKYLKKCEKDEEYSEMLVDTEEEVSKFLNDSWFRSDQIGEKVCTNEKILDLVYEYLAKDNENIEVVLATNPYISKNLLENLLNSNFSWEEDGTQQVLARNRKEAGTLQKLSEVDDWNVQHAVAMNSNTPADVLEHLVTSTGQCNFQVEEFLFGEVSPYKGFVRWACLENPNISKVAIEKVLKGELESLGTEIDEIILNIAKSKG